jgi:voltage-gated potassium channel
MNLKIIIEETNTTAGRIFDLFIQTLIIASIITFSIETLPDLEDKTKDILFVIETFIVVIFTIEYLLRIYIADKKSDYIFSFYGIVDFIAIIPFYISLGIVDLRTLRILRMLRLFRLFKLVRYNTAMQRFYRAFHIVKEELVLFGIVTLMLLYVSAVGIYYFEHESQPEQFKSIFHSFWWAVTTLTTVGYGDIYPITIGGRLFTFFMLMIGLGIVAVPACLLSAALTQVKIEEHDEDK